MTDYLPNRDTQRSFAQKNAQHSDWSRRRFGLLVMKMSFVILFGLMFSCFAQVLAGTYTTSFPLSENPISEGGAWINGKAVGGYWSDCATTNHYAYGLQPGTNYSKGIYDDSTALLTGTWGPTQSVTAVVRTINQQNAPVYEEVEICLRNTLSNNWRTGYLVNWSLHPDSSAYLQMGYFEGPAGLFLPPGTMPSTSGSQCILHDGDTIQATITNYTINVFLNGTLLLTGTDVSNRWATGNPGFGFYLQGATSVNTDYGIKSFTATDFIEPLRPTLAIRWDGDDFHLTGRGQPNRSFTFQFTSGLGPPNWQPIATVFSDDSGLFEYVDPFPVWEGARFYRVVSP